MSSYVVIPLLLQRFSGYTRLRLLKKNGLVGTTEKILMNLTTKLPKLEAQVRTNHELRPSSCRGATHMEINNRLLD